MDTIDLFLLLTLLAVLAAVVYLIAHSLPPRVPSDPFEDFDRWQQAFHAGIEARHCGLDPEDNPFVDSSRDYCAWLDGYEAAGRHMAALGREVA